MTDKKKDPVIPYRVLFIVIFSVIVILAVILIATARTEKAHPIRVGCVFDGSITETGWNSRNYEGLSEACSKNNISLTIKENVQETEKDCVNAVNELVNEGCTAVFLSSSGYTPFIGSMQELFRGVRFFSCGAQSDEDLPAYYFGRMYQGRYLSGIIAALTTRSGVLGYVAAMDNCEVDRGINAFALGALSVDPEARVKVIFTGSWDDAEAEKAAVAKLIDMSADVIAYHQNQENVPEACDAAGIDFIGTYGLSGAYSEHYLTSIDCSWEKVYAAAIRDVMSRRAGNGSSYWLGIEDDAVSLTDYSENVSVRARDEVMSAMNRMKAGRSIFSGEIYDNSGVLRCGSGEALSDRTLLLGMNWLVQGVEVVEG